jgi:hypothetical protein
LEIGLQVGGSDGEAGGHASGEQAGSQQLLQPAAENVMRRESVHGADASAVPMMRELNFPARA